MKKVLLSVLCLALLLAVMAAGVLGVNAYTAPIVAENERLAEEARLAAEKEKLGDSVLLFDREKPEESTLEVTAETVQKVYADESKQVYTLSLATFQGYTKELPIELTLIVDYEGRIVSLSVDSTGETKELSEDFLPSFEGQDSTLAEVQLVAGVTFSSSAIKNAVNDGFNTLIDNGLFAAAEKGEDQLLSELLPLDGKGLLCSSFPALDLLAFALAARFFFLPGEAGRGEAFLPCALRLGLFCLLLCGVGVAVQGRFGAALSARLSAPFFALVRNLVFFRSLERMEALVVGLWILPDFLLGSLCLHGAQRCLRLAFGFLPGETESRLDLSGGRLLIWLCGTVSVALGLLLGRDPARLQLWSRTVVPLLNLFFSFLLLPGTLLLCGRKGSGK